MFQSVERRPVKRGGVGEGTEFVDQPKQIVLHEAVLLRKALYTTALCVFQAWWRNTNRFKPEPSCRLCVSGRGAGGAEIGRQAGGQTQTDSIPGRRPQPVPDHRGAVRGLEEQTGCQLSGHKSLHFSCLHAVSFSLFRPYIIYTVELTSKPG